MRIGFLAIALAALIAAAAPAEQVSADNPASPPAEEAKAAIVGVIPISGTVDYGSQKSLERRVSQALNDKVEVIIFEMDTYGGGLEPAIEMGDLINNIKSETDGKVKTVAYVHKKAISAGALISLACQEIIMRNSTRIGDCEPIMVNPQTQTMETAPEKIRSMVRAVMRTYAKSNGYPVALCEAMVDQDAEVWRVTDKDGARTRYLLTRQLEAEDEDVKKVLIIPKGQLLTMHDKRAKDLGFSRASVRNRQEAIARYAATNAQTIRYETNWSEELVRFLNSTAVASVLMLVGMISLYMAFKTPGFGPPEIVAISCFAILFLSKYMVGLATEIEVLLFAVGVVLLAVEVFVIPGFGVVGIAGIVCIIASLVLALQKFTIPKYDFQVDILIENLVVVFGSLLAATLIFMIAVRYMAKTPVLSRLVHATSEAVESGYVVGSAEMRELVGAKGLALTTLRPSGRAEIADNIMIVVAENEFIEAGAPVVVTKVRGNKIVVTRA